MQLSNEGDFCGVHKRTFAWMHGAFFFVWCQKDSLEAIRRLQNPEQMLLNVSMFHFWWFKSIKSDPLAYLDIETDKDHGSCDEHNWESSQHERFPARLLDEDQRHEGHGDVAGSHAKGGHLSLVLIQASGFEDRRRVEDGLK